MGKTYKDNKYSDDDFRYKGRKRPRDSSKGKRKGQSRDYTLDNDEREENRHWKHKRRPEDPTPYL